MTTTATRPYLTAPETRVETKFGPLLVTANGGTTVYVHTESGSRATFLNVRGVDYSVSAHLEQDGDGWKIQGDRFTESTYLHLSRVGGDWNRPVSDSARKAIKAVVMEVAAQHSSGETRRAGRLVTINNDIGSLDKKIAEAEAALATMQDERARLRAEEALLHLEENA
jgi:hypothetical protein